MGLPKAQRDSLDLREAEVAGGEALDKRCADPLGEFEIELGRKVAGMALKRSLDDRRQCVCRQGLQLQCLVDELGDGAKQMLDLAQVVLAKDEQQLDRERLALQSDEHLDDPALDCGGTFILKERDDLFELVEDQQRPLSSAGLADAVLERLHRYDDPRRVVCFGGKQRL
jgi:hypothetical protein